MRKKTHVSLPDSPFADLASRSTYPPCRHSPCRISGHWIRHTAVSICGGPVLSGSNPSNCRSRPWGAAQTCTLNCLLPDPTPDGKPHCCSSCADNVGTYTAASQADPPQPRLRHETMVDVSANYRVEQAAKLQQYLPLYSIRKLSPRSAHPPID